MIAAVALSARPALAGPVVNCADLTSMQFGDDVKIESAATIAATERAPEHCEVRGTIWPENKFGLGLPAEWNHRFYMEGNGGTGGSALLNLMNAPMKKGFAAAVTDMGHDQAKEPGASFAYPGPDNPNAARKVVDFAYLATHETAVLAKKIIQAYYGEAPRHSFWLGCSTGGRQGLMEAQRYPEDFDGIVAGSAVLNHTGTLMRHIWNARAAQEGPGAIPVEKLPLLASAVYKKCDSIDGLQDGLIDDPRKCKFDPASDLPACSSGADDPNCFTKAQVDSLKKIYGGVRNSAGKQLFPATLPGAEFIQGNNPQDGKRSGWYGNIVGPSGGLQLAESYLRFMIFDPPPGPTWDYRKYNFDTDPAKMAAVGAKVNATNPDLKAFKAHGGKLIQYHGWADPMVNPLMALDYYESVRQTMGETAAGEFYRFYLIPGMFHCGAGPGCGLVDWLTPMVDWVERGTAPETLIGSHFQQGKINRTRPVCPYPQVEKYKGTGSIDQAENFTCAAR